MPIEDKRSSSSIRNDSSRQNKTWMNYPFLRSIRRKALAIIASLAILLSLLGLLVDARQAHPPVFVSVSVKTLLEEHLHSVVESTDSSLLIEQETTKYLNAIEGVIQELSSQGDVIVLISEAVMGSGVPDFTDEVRQQVKAKLDSQANQLRSHDHTPIFDTKDDGSQQIRKESMQ